MLGRFWEGFGKPKWMPKSNFRSFFFRCFFRARFDIDFGWIFGASEPEKSTKTIVFLMVFVNFHRIDAFEQIAKKHRFWSRFRKPKPRQIEKKSRWKTCVFLTSIFWRCFWIFCDFGSILGSQKSIKNQNKSNKIASKNEKTLILGRALFGGRPPEGFGRVLGRFWESFERIWGGFGGVTLDGQAKPSQAKPRPPLFKRSQPKLQIWVPLICVDLRWFPLRPDVSISNIKINHTFFVIISMLGRFREVLGGPNGGQNRFFNRFFSMLFSNAFWHRFWVDFWNLGTRQINKNHCFFNGFC